jgi:GT2 family glycosyltransferase
MRHKPISIVIPTWNGRRLIETYVPSVLAAAAAYPATSEIIVVDDGSSDGTEAFLRETYPQITVVVREKNGGFARACNTGVERCQHGIVVLLNNDMRVDRDFFVGFSRHFDDPRLFAVLPSTPKIWNEPYADQRCIRIGLQFKYGFFETPIYEISSSAQGPNDWHTFKLSGGAAAIGKKKFLEIGGFDEMFSPFYWEDVDLSYRAWKKGWCIVYEPLSVARHRVHSTINRYNFKDTSISWISERNRYILVWKNVFDKKLLLKHFAFIPIRLFYSIVKGRLTVSLMALAGALKILPEIRLERKRQKRFQVFSDADILHQFSSPDRYDTNVT